MNNLAAATKFEATIAHGEIGYDADIDEPATAITVRCATCEAPAGHRCAYRHGESSPVHATRAHAARNVPAAASDARGLKVACPICHAADGDPCTEGDKAIHVHMTRLAAADAAIEPDPELVRQAAEILYGRGTQPMKKDAAERLTGREVFTHVTYNATGRADVLYAFDPAGERIIHRPVR